MNRIFLGGTCNNTTWRKEIEDLVDVDMFNPVVEDWTADCQAIEMDEKSNKCNIHLYVITAAMSGVFSIAEVMDSVHDNSKRTILHVMPQDFTKGQLKSLKATVELVNLRGGIAYIDANINRTVNVLNYAFGTELEIR